MRLFCPEEVYCLSLLWSLQCHSVALLSCLYFAHLLKLTPTPPPLTDQMVLPARFHKVSLSGNALTSVSNTAFASNNTNVLLLDLTANTLQSVGPNAFAGLANLQTLDLSNNNIREICNQVRWCW